MVNKKISRIFELEVYSDNEGSVVIPAHIFTKNVNAIDDIKELLVEESRAVGQPFYYSTVLISSGVMVTWSKDFKDSLPALEGEEELLGDGLTYIVRRVG